MAAPGRRIQEVAKSFKRLNSHTNADTPDHNSLFTPGGHWCFPQESDQRSEVSAHQQPEDREVSKPPISVPASER